MNKDLQSILNFIQQSEYLSDEEKNTLSKAAKDVNKELEIESSLERVRTVAMSMNKPDDMLGVCHTISDQLELLNVKEIRNVQTAIFYKEKGMYMNYEYYAKHNKTFITETSYTNHEIHQNFADKMLKGNGEFMIAHIKGDEVKDWLAYQKTTNVFIDDYLSTASSLNYYWYSLGPVALGISTYNPLNEDETNLFKRFLKVFELSYRRYLDIEKAEAQAYEAKVEASMEKVRAVAMSMNKPDDMLNICETLFKEFTAFDFTDLRNAMINIHDDEKKTFVNYDYSNEIGKSTNHLTYNIHPIIEKQIAQVRRSNDAFSETVFSGADLDDWIKFRKEIGEKDDPTINKTAALHYYFYSIGTGAIGISTFTPVNDQNLKLLKRFRNVFNLSYQRYTDLALAEAQSKEAQIELALERVRARTMAMQKSDELKEAAALLFQQVKSLGVPAYSCGYNIWGKNEKTFTSWMSSEDGSIINAVLNIPLTEDANFIGYVESKQKGEQFFVLELRGQRMQEHYQYLNTIPAFKEYFDYAVSVGFDLPETQIHHLANFSQGNLLFITLEPCPEFHDLFKRLAAVFEQTYTRFLDLQKSEEQARESQIQLALERVRARTMAMQKSDELAETASLLFKQLLALGIKSTQMRTCAITTLKSDQPIGECWITKPDGDIIPHSFLVPYNETSAYKTIYAAWKNGEKFLVVNLSGDALVQHLNFLKKYAKIPTQQFQALPEQPTETFTHAMFFSQGYLFIISNVPLPEYHEIFKRFGAIFQQTYTRFLDLKNAEAQARESQIQLALERVRARTMAMQKSEELAQTVFILFQQFKELGENPDQATIGVVNEQEGVIEYWVTMYGNQTNRVYKFPIKEPNVTNRIYYAWKEQKKSLVIELSGQELFDFANFRESMGGAAFNPEEKKRVINVAFFSKGIINVQSNELRSSESINLLERFAAVFEQTYTRFLDLQKAEEQARESQIEAALERVRSRSMAMQKSEDLKEVIQVVYDQFVHLNIHVEHTGFIMDYKERNDMHIWLADNHEVPSEITIPYFDSPHWNSFNEAKEKGIDLFANLLNFEEKNKFYHDLFQLIPGVPDETRNYYLSCPGLAGSTVLLDNVGLYIENFSGTPYTDEENKTLMRFGNVFQQTYTRFLDLQKAEAQAKEAQIETALEKVRSRTLAMQKSGELAETSAVLFKQLIGLGIAPNRLYINIVADENGNAEFWITDEDGSKVSMAYQDNMHNNPTFEKMFDGWKKQKKSLVIDMKDEELRQYFEYLSSIHVPFKDGLEQKRRVQYIAYFSKGFIGMAAPEEQPAETLQLLERFAYVFNLTFTRFSDLKIAEAHAIKAEQDLMEIKSARKKAEETLAELQATQTQLIQSEKMASLGELTAGIAHEIQNPLNFVNNFSEVSNELIEELQEERIKAQGTRDEKMEDEILNDIKQNLEKINHHGKRADAIVKGMLEHSRVSAGEKELADINTLADEYLRLSYQGLRAKDKAFNSAIKTDFDNSIGKINIVQQDIGRVLLNLYNNAFYSVNEKRKLSANSYEPIASVSTRKLINKIEIRVEDNGNGIAQKVIDKIFQPFFTTKPTGQGTGLGLSLSYDIIKAHGGEIKVETKEGEGSTFIIQLPIV